MSVKKNKDEILENVATPIVRDFRGEVDKILREKIGSLVQAFENERGKYLAELERLQSQLEGFEGKKGALCAERKSLTSGVFGVGVKGAFDFDLKLRGLEKEIKSFEAQKGKLFSRLTEIPKLDFQSLNFLTNLTRKG